MKKESESLTDDSVSAAYREFSAEKAPPELDRAVLDEARVGVRPEFWKNFYAWRRPLAFAATLILGIALVHDMHSLLEQTDDSLLPRPNLRNESHESSDFRLGAPPDSERDSSMETAPSPSGRDLAPATGARSLQKGGAVQADDALNPDRLDTETRGIEPQPEPKGSAGNATRRVAIPPASPEAASRKTTAERVREESGSTLPAADACDEDQVAAADSWWRCIEELRAAGLERAADAELRKLKTRFPGFETLE